MFQHGFETNIWENTPCTKLVLQIVFDLTFLFFGVRQNCSVFGLLGRITFWGFQRFGKNFDFFETNRVGNNIHRIESENFRNFWKVCFFCVGASCARHAILTVIKTSEMESTERVDNPRYLTFCLTPSNHEVTAMERALGDSKNRKWRLKSAAGPGKIHQSAKPNLAQAEPSGGVFWLANFKSM